MISVQEFPEERRGEIDALLADGRKILAIKRVRELYKLGLKEAKDCIDDYIGVQSEKASKDALRESLSFLSAWASLALRHMDNAPNLKEYGLKIQNEVREVLAESQRQS